MSPPRRQRYRWNIAFATGCRRVGRRKWTNRRIRVPAFMRSCRIEEELTLVKTLGKEVEEYVTKVIAKDGTVTRFEGRFPHFIEGEEEKKPKPYNLYGFVDLMENEQVYAKNGFAPHRIPQPEGNHNGWLSEEEEADSDNESTAKVCRVSRWIEKMETVIDNSGCAENQKVKYVAILLVNKALTWWNTQVQARGREAANAMSWNDFKALLVEEFCPSNEMERLENEFWNHKMIGANHAGYMDRFHELAKLVPHFVKPESARIKRYMAGLAPKIRVMLKATQPATIKSVILKAGILTNEAVSNGTLTKSSEKRKSVDEPAKASGSGRGVKKAKDEAAKDSSVVTGTFSLNDHFATILFDTGADFSFISTKFAPILNVKPSIANPGYVIEIAD
ncbi:reverse transcriptase domain-containing protein [Tanacetum coccineum]